MNKDAYNFLAIYVRIALLCALFWSAVAWALGARPLVIAGVGAVTFFLAFLAFALAVAGSK